MNSAGAAIILDRPRGISESENRGAREIYAAISLGRC